MQKTMKDIDKLASSGKSEKTRSRDNLITVKVFVFNTLIKILGLDYLYNLTLFDAFRYIIVDDNPAKVKEIIKYE